MKRIITNALLKKILVALFIFFAPLTNNHAALLNSDYTLEDFVNEISRNPHMNILAKASRIKILKGNYPNTATVKNLIRLTEIKIMPATLLLAGYNKEEFEAANVSLGDIIADRETAVKEEQDIQSTLQQKPLTVLLENDNSFKMRLLDAGYSDQEIITAMRSSAESPVVAQETAQVAYPINVTEPSTKKGSLMLKILAGSVGAAALALFYAAYTAL